MQIHKAASAWLCTKQPGPLSPVLQHGEVQACSTKVQVCT
jgi:hypothetical protein